MMKKTLAILFFILISCIRVFATPQELYYEAIDSLRDYHHSIENIKPDYDYWKNKYNDLKTYEDAYIAIDSVIQTLNDKYTYLIPQQDIVEQEQVAPTQYVGIGVEIIQKHNKILLNPIDNLPAQKAGIRKNDILLKINNLSINDKSLEEVFDLFDGNIGETISLEIKRKKEIKTYNIIFEEIYEPSIFLTPILNTKIPKNIGYLYISSFVGKNISKEFKDKMGDIDKDAYIIDLRFNSGGTVKYAAEIANMLLKNQNIFTMINNVGEKRAFDANEHLLTDKPVILLINKDSASSSEILSGALKDNKRAIVIGEKSFGKGVIQKKIKLQDNSLLAITNAYYLTPNGNCIHNKGIEPDIEIKLNTFDYLIRNDRQLKKAIKILSTKPL